MGGLQDMRGVCRLLCLIVLFGLGVAASGWADSGDFTLAASMGGAYLPMGEWKEFVGGTGHYHTDALGQTWEVALRHQLSRRLLMALSVGGVTTSATLTDIMYLTYDSTAFHIAWDFEGHPIGLSVEFYPLGTEAAALASFGLGCSYYFSELDGRLDIIPDMGLPETPSGAHREGSGYGVHAYVSAEARISRALVVISRLRVQYADGMAFTQRKGSVPVRFSGVDLSVGLGWRLSSWGRARTGGEE